MRFLALVVLLATAAAPVVLAQQTRTTRIETRPYYGAVVTIEHGVRVYRPVPPTTHLIVNPDAATPLSIQVGEGATTYQPPQRTTQADR